MTDREDQLKMSRLGKVLIKTLNRFKIYRLCFFSTTYANRPPFPVSDEFSVTPPCYETFQLSCGLTTDKSMCSDYYDIHVDKSHDAFNPWELQQQETVMVNTAVESKNRLGMGTIFI